MTPARYNITEFALSDALKSYLQECFEQVLPVRFTHELEDSEYPCVFISDGVAVENPEGSATYDVTTVVGIATRQSTPRAEHIEFVGQLMDLIYNDGFIDELNNSRSPGLLVQRVQKLMRSTDSDGAVRRTSQQLSVMCAMCAI